MLGFITKFNISFAPLSASFYYFFTMHRSLNSLSQFSKLFHRATFIGTTAVAAAEDTKSSSQSVYCSSYVLNKTFQPLNNTM